MWEVGRGQDGVRAVENKGALGHHLYKMGGEEGGKGGRKERAEERRQRARYIAKRKQETRNAGSHY